MSKYLDTQQALRLRNELKAYYSQMHRNMKLQENFYEQEITLPNQLKGIEPHIAPTARTIIETATNQIMQLGQINTVLLWRETDAAKVTASRLKKVDAAYLGNISNGMRYNVRRMATKQCLLYGEYFVKGPIYQPRLAPEKNPGESASDFKDRIAAWEETLDCTFPFGHAVTNPMCILKDPSPRTDFIFEDYMRRNADIKACHPEWEDLPDTGYSRWTAYYSNRQKIYIVNNDARINTDNLYGFIPYECGNAGYGNEDEKSAPEKAVVGILSPALRTLKADVILRTTVLYGLQYAVFGKKVTDFPPGTAGPWNYSNIPGDVSTVDPKYNLRDISPTQMNPDTWRLLSMLDTDMQQIMPKAQYGNLPKGITSGSMFVTSIIQGSQSLKETQNQWAMTASNMCNKLHLLVKYVVQEPIGILGTLATGDSIIKITPAMLHPDVQVASVSLDPMSPEDRSARINLGVLLWRSKAASKETICEDFFGLDWTIERNRMLVESILESPQVEQVMAQSALESAGLMEVWDVLRQNGMQVPQFPGAVNSLRRAQPGGMQEVPRFPDYNPALIAEHASTSLPDRAIYGAGPEQGMPTGEPQ